MTGEEILEFIEESVNEMIKYGNTPHAIICSKKTFKIVAKAIRKLGRFREFDDIVPQQLWIKYDFGDVPVIKHKYCPIDRVHVVDKDTYKRIMNEEIK